MTQHDIDHAFCQNVGYPEDCARIRAVASERLGVFITLSQAETIWNWHSECHAASWLIIRDDDEIESAISSFVNCALT